MNIEAWRIVKAKHAATAFAGDGAEERQVAKRVARDEGHERVLEPKTLRCFHA